MSNIKKLDCPFKRYERRHEWYKERNEKLTYELKNYYKEVAPIVGSDGWYYRAGYCWYEFEGKAYLARSEDFTYQMQMLNAGEYSDAEYNALRQLERLNSNLLTKCQKDFLRKYRQHLYCKKVRAESLVRVKKMRERVTKGDGKEAS